MNTALASKLRTNFIARFGSEPRLFRAPGRVNLIGEHTDYNDGFVMPAAIGFDTWVAACPAAGKEIKIYSEQESEEVGFPLGEVAPQPRHDWSDYVRGVAIQLERSGISVPGATLLIDSRVPIAAGLSSSAALEVATALSLLALSGQSMERSETAKLCQRAENQFVGAQCGIMDQFASLYGKKNHAVLLDCRSLDTQYLTLSEQLRLVICNTMVKHSVAAGEYNSRRAQCEMCIRELSRKWPRVTSLRDVSEDMLCESATLLPGKLLQRCRHVVTESARVLRAAEALKSGRLEQFGHLMYESHVSLREDYEVSCPELDLMVEIGRKLPGLVGARMTGGGFGGCTVNLVEKAAVDNFVAQISREYENATQIRPEIYVTEAADGASSLS